MTGEAGHWVTIDGEHVFIKGGVIEKGPANLTGKTLGEAASQGHPVTAVHGTTKPAMAWREIAGDHISAPLSHSGDYTISHREGAHSVSYRPPGQHQHVGEFATDAEAKAAAEKHAAAKPVADQYDNPGMNRAFRISGYTEAELNKKGISTARMEKVYAAAKAAVAEVGTGDADHLAGEAIRQSVIASSVNDGIRHATDQLPQEGSGFKLAQAFRKHWSEMKSAPLSTSMGHHGYVILAASSTFAPPAKLAADLPREINGQPVEYFDKEMIYTGRMFDTNNGEVFDVTPERLDNWVRNYHRWTEAGNRVPILKRHTEQPTADDSMGYVVNARRDGEKLFGLHQFIGTDAIRAASRNNSSVYVVSGKTDAKGNVYDEVLLHNAVCPDPLVPGTAPFKLAASAGGGEETPVSVVTNKPPQRSTSMNLVQELRAALGLSDTATDEQISTAFKERMGKIPTLEGELKTTSDKLAASQSAVTAADQKVLALSQSGGAPKLPDDLTLGLLSRTIKTEREQAIKAGGITPAIAEEIDGLFMAGGKPTTLALSQSAGEPLVFRIWSILAKNKPVPTGQQSAGVTFAASASGVGEDKKPPTEAEQQAAADKELERTPLGRRALANRK